MSLGTGMKIIQTIKHSKSSTRVSRDHNCQSSVKPCYKNTFGTAKKEEKSKSFRPSWGFNKMWFRGGLGGGGGSNIGSIVKNQIVRHFSRARAVDVKRINPKVPFSEAASIAQSLYQVIKEHGPLTVSNTWNQAKEANISGLNSKTHMKIMLKWMRGRKMLKLFCNPNSKKFLHCSLPEEPRTEQSDSAPELNMQTKRKPSKKKSSVKRKKQHK